MFSASGAEFDALRRLHVMCDYVAEHLVTGCMAHEELSVHYIFS